MRFIAYQHDGAAQLGAVKGERVFGASSTNRPSADLAALLSAGDEALSDEYERLLKGPELSPENLVYLPPLPRPEKIICVGLNYRDHAAESGFQPPTYPALFGRFSSSLIGHLAPIVRPIVSNDLDYEGELVAIMGKAGRHIPRERALEYVAGYSIFNDASIRDYQFKSAQWTIGKNFDDTGAFDLFSLLPTNSHLARQACASQRA